MVIVSTEKRRALALVRTPFQAWLLEKVLEAEGVNAFDLVYFTQNDSAEDRNYYTRLSSRACAAKFVFVPRQTPDLLNHLLFSVKAWPFVFGKEYKTTVASSIDSYVINAFSNRSSGGDLVTFDDGTANYNQSGSYFIDSPSFRARFYRDIFRARSITETKSRIARHYTIHPKLENIVDQKRVIPLTGWEKTTSRANFTQGTKTYFIGAPFSEVLDPQQIEKLKSQATKLKIDVYVQHPREVQPLALAAACLEKNGRIAEEAILEDAGNQQIILVGFLSTVMFNLASRAVRRIILVPRASKRHSFLIDLAQKSGCEIISLDDEELCQ